MIRTLNWNPEGGESLCDQLMDKRRIEEIQIFLASQSEETPQEMINRLNERGDLTDSEWTAVICTLGAHFFTVKP